MRKILAFLVGLLPVLVSAGGGPHTCVWGSACTFPVDIYATDGVDFAATADIAIAVGDIEWYCPGQAVNNTSSSVAEIAPRGFVLTVPSSLTTCARFEVKIRDQDVTAAYLAASFSAETCGNASAAHVNCSGALSTLALDDPLDGTLTVGCALSSINAVETGAQTVVNGTDYTYRNTGDTEDRVVSTRTASGRAQATITCPAGL